jgi:hypothetical protein
MAAAEAGIFISFMPGGLFEELLGELGHAAIFRTSATSPIPRTIARNLPDVILIYMGLGICTLCAELNNSTDARTTLKHIFAIMQIHVLLSWLGFALRSCHLLKFFRYVKSTHHYIIHMYTSNVGVPNNMHK